MRAANELALVMEVTEGCRMGCKGCRIDKTGSGLPSDDVLEKLLGMLYQLKAQGVGFAEVELGATDMLSANNRDEIFSHPLVAEIVRLFKVTVINAAFIDPQPDHYIRLAQQVNTLSPDNAVGLVTPMEMTQAFNDKYISRIQKNVTLFKQHLNNPFTEVLFSIIIDHNQMRRSDIKRSYGELFVRARQLRVSERTKVDFAFHHGREGLRMSTDKEDLLQTIHALNDQYVQDLLTRDIVHRGEVPAQLFEEEEVLELVLSDCDLYIRPILNERLMVKNRIMRYHGAWDAYSLLKHFDDRVQRNENLAKELKVCSTCPHVKRCATRYTQELMALGKTQDCISLLGLNTPNTTP